MSEEEVAFAEIIGDLVEQWGFKRHLGRIWSILYMSVTPLSPTDIQESLSLSAGSVSAALAELQTWGVVKRIRVAGDRNFYYEPETQIWKSVSNVLRTRELRILQEAHSGLTVLATNLQSKPKNQSSELQIKRIKHVREAIDTAQNLFGFLINGAALSLPKVGKVFQRLRSL